MRPKSRSWPANLAKPRNFVEFPRLTKLSPIILSWDKRKWPPAQLKHRDAAGDVSAGRAPSITQVGYNPRHLVGTLQIDLWQLGWTILGKWAFHAKKRATQRYLGHGMNLVTTEGAEAPQLIDDRELTKQWDVSVSEMRIVSGVGVVIGSSSLGGYACDGSSFVIYLPPNQTSTFDGPVGNRFSIKWSFGNDKVVFRPAATAAQDGQEWRTSCQRSRFA